MFKDRINIRYLKGCWVTVLKEKGNIIEDMMTFWDTLLGGFDAGLRQISLEKEEDFVLCFSEVIEKLWN